MSRIEGRRAGEEGPFVRGWRTTDGAWLTADARQDGSPPGPPAVLPQARQAASTSLSVPARRGGGIGGEGERCSPKAL